MSRDNTGWDQEGFDKLRQEVKLESQKKQKNQNQNQNRNRKKVLRKVGITTEIYQELSNSQMGCCAICGQSQDKLLKHLSVDRHSVTGQIRGLLCCRCNGGLRLIDKYPVEVQAYLKKHEML